MSLELKNTKGSYGLVGKTLHWVVASLIFILLGLGFFMAGMEFTPAKLELYTLHKSLGMVVLILAGLRIGWRWINISPEELATHQAWEKILSKIVHVLLYAAMIIMPLSGWLMSSAAEFPNKFFWLFDVPKLMGKNEGVFHAMRDVHTISAFVLIAIIALHMAGAFKHHFIDRDDTLRRMTTRRIGFIGGAGLAVVAGILWFTPVALIVGAAVDKAAVVEREAVEDVVDAVTSAGADVNADIGDRAWVVDYDQQLWAIDYDKSSIGFEVTQYGTPFTGSFPKFQGHIEFDPDNLGRSYVRIVIEIASIATGAPDRDQQARGAEWFDVAQFPAAAFEASEFTRLDDGGDGAARYEVSGVLTIRGHAVRVAFPFDLSITDDGEGGEIAVMTAKTQLDRLEFGVGQGQWQATDAIGGNVLVNLHVEARRGD